MNPCPHCGWSMSAQRGFDLCLNVLCNGGQNGTRAANQAAYGNPGASPYASGGAGLTQQNPYTSGLAQYSALQNASPGGVNWASLMQAQSAQSQAMTMVVSSQLAFGGREQRTPLDHAGTSFGELIGWRIWGLCQGYLTSYSADYAWLPGHPTEGDVSDHGTGGIWAFKDAHRAFKKALESSTLAMTFLGNYHIEGWVTGSIWMYGEVIEHRIGYRSQYAMVRSIDAVIPNEDNLRRGWREWNKKREMRRQSQAMLEELRERYGVKEEVSQ